MECDTPSPGDIPGLTLVGPLDGVRVLTDTVLAERDGIRVAFTERCGGVSLGPFASLDLAAHVGDDTEAVDENRTRLLDALGAGALRERLTCAEQVHGSVSALVGAAEVGSGAFAASGTRTPMSGVDSLLTTLAGVPVALYFADCVPVVLVARRPVRAVAVVHAGWRGAVAGIVADAARRLSSLAGCPPSDLIAYVGPHIGRCCYQVGPEVAEAFVATGVMASAVIPERESSDGPVCFRLDLGEAVAASLAGAGVPREAQCHVGLCTAENTDRFFSFRASGGVTGRHSALALIER